MKVDLILQGKATLEDLFALHALGYEFVVEDGRVAYVY